jgi:hypothetical protein
MVVTLRPGRQVADSGAIPLEDGLDKSFHRHFVAEYSVHDYFGILSATFGVRQAYQWVVLALAIARLG